MKLLILPPIFFGGRSNPVRENGSVVSAKDHNATKKSMLFSRQQLVVNPSELRILRRERKYFHPKTSRVVIETSNYANLDSNHQLRSHHRHLENRNFRIQIDVFSSEKVCYWAVWRAEIQFAVHFRRILLHFYLLTLQNDFQNPQNSDFPNVCTISRWSRTPDSTSNSRDSFPIGSL